MLPIFFYRSFAANSVLLLVKRRSSVRRAAEVIYGKSFPIQGVPSVSVSHSLSLSTNLCRCVKGSFHDRLCCRGAFAFFCRCTQLRWNDRCYNSHSQCSSPIVRLSFPSFLLSCCPFVVQWKGHTEVKWSNTRPTVCTLDACWAAAAAAAPFGGLVCFHFTAPAPLYTPRDERRKDFTVGQGETKRAKKKNTRKLFM